MMRVPLPMPTRREPAGRRRSHGCAATIFITAILWLAIGLAVKSCAG